MKVVSRFQLVFAMLMFAGSPAWIALLLVGTFVLANAPSASAVIDADYGAPLLAAVLLMWFAAKALTVIDVLARPTLRRAYGGSGGSSPALRPRRSSRC